MLLTSDHRAMCEKEFALAVVDGKEVVVKRRRARKKRERFSTGSKYREACDTFFAYQCELTNMHTNMSC